jgi:hypothetical protein
MKPTTTFALLAAALASSACVTQPLAQKGGGGGVDTSGWSCSARGMVMGRYGGGDDAYIQLSGFARGGDYPVKLNQQGNVATGTTGNGTPFTCTKR